MNFPRIEDHHKERTAKEGDGDRSPKPPRCMLNMKGELLLNSRRTVGEDRETVISCPATALDTSTVQKIGREGGRGHSLEADR